MSTILRNIQNVLNNHSLTFCYDDLTKPLVPKNLVYGRKIYDININDDTTTYDENSTKFRRCRYVQYLINSFWKQWQIEYLKELRKTQQKQSISVNQCLRHNLGYKQKIIQFIRRNQVYFSSSNVSTDTTVIVKDYMLSEMSRFNSKCEIPKDDIVLIQTDKYNRINWKMNRAVP